MGNKKIAIIRPIGHIIDPDSYNCQEIGLARGLASHGVDVDVFLAGEGKRVQCSTATAPGPGQVRIFQLPFFTLPEIGHAIYPSLRQLLTEGKYDLIHVNEENELTSFLVSRLGRKLGVPVIIYQGMYLPITGRIRAAFQKFYDLLLLPVLRKNIHLAVAKTTQAEQFLRSKGFARTAVIPVGLDPAPFGDVIQIDWKQRLNLPEGAQIILYVGVFEERRNIHFLLDVAKVCGGQGNLYFVLIGSGPEYESIRQRKERQHLDHVLLLGRLRQKQLPSLYRQSSLFLLASSYEIYGMVVLEAMYFGVPVLSTATAGPRDIISSGNDGILLEKLDVNKWAETINELCRDRKKLDMMQNAARRKIQEALVWKVVSKEYLKRIFNNN